MKKWDFYIAGPLFSKAELNYNFEMYQHLMKMGYACFLPQLSFQDKDQPLTIFMKDLENLLESHAVIAICDGADMDSGTAWECGCFYGMKLIFETLSTTTGIVGLAEDLGPIYALRSDFRKSGDDPIEGFNLMISQSADEVFSSRQDLYNFIGTSICPRTFTIKGS